MNVGAFRVYNGLGLDTAVNLRLVTVHGGLAYASSTPPTRTRQDCRVLSCWWSEQNGQQVKTVFSSPQYTRD